jgi:hypothetical protein
MCIEQRPGVARPTIERMQMMAGMLQWTSEGKQIRANGKRINIKGGELVGGSVSD